MDGDEGIVSAIGHGLQIAGDAAVGFGVLGFSEAAGDLLLDLAHAQVAFGAVVRERGVRVAGELAATARRDLGHLVEFGALRRTGQLKGTRYWLAHSRATPDGTNPPEEAF